MAYICNFDLNLKAPNRSAPNQRCGTEVLFKARFTLRVKLGKTLLVGHNISGGFPIID